MYTLLLGLFGLMMALGGFFFLRNADFYQWALGAVLFVVGQFGMVNVVQANYDGPCDDDQAFVISVDGDRFCVEVEADEQQTLEA